MKTRRAKNNWMATWQGNGDDASPIFYPAKQNQEKLLMRKREFGELSNRNYLIRIVGALQSILYNILVVLR